MKTSFPIGSSSEYLTYKCIQLFHRETLLVNITVPIIGVQVKTNFLTWTTSEYNFSLTWSTSEYNFSHREY